MKFFDVFVWCNYCSKRIARATLKVRANGQKICPECKGRVRENSRSSGAQRERLYPRRRAA